MSKSKITSGPIYISIPPVDPREAAKAAADAFNKELARRRDVYRLYSIEPPPIEPRRKFLQLFYDGPFHGQVRRENGRPWAEERIILPRLYEEMERLRSMREDDWWSYGHERHAYRLVLGQHFMREFEDVSVAMYEYEGPVS